MKTFIAMTLLLSNAAFAWDDHTGGAVPLADKRCHVEFTSEDGAQIQVAYSVFVSQNGDVIYMDGIRLYASGRSLSADKNVRFVMISRDPNNESQIVQFADASYEYKEYGYVAQAQFALEARRTNGGDRILELAIVASGNWLQAKKGVSNFRLNLSSFKDACADPR
jgi:hypothetical protein